MEIAVGILIGLAVGVAIHFAFRAKSATDSTSLIAEKSRLEGQLAQLTFLKDELGKKDAEVGALNARLTAVKATSAEFEERAAAAERSKQEMLKAQEESFNEQKKLLSDAEKILGEKFGEMSLKSLEQAQKTFVEMANAKFEGTSKEANKELEKRQQAFEAMVKPLSESLDKLDKQAAIMDHGIKTLTQETDQLANAMRKPTSRGDWGEMILVQTLQKAGMVEGQHFDVEDSTEDADGTRRRADVVIHLPHGRDIIIDAKTPLEAFTEGMNATDELVRRERFAHHAKLVKAHIVHLSSKKYWERYGKSADFVILFLPTEGAYQAAIQSDPSLMDEGQTHKVYLANPVSVMSMVHLAHTTWRQKEFVESAEIVREHAAELYKRLASYVSHVQSMGLHLDRMVKSYNLSVGSLESNVLPQGRRIQELKATNAEEIKMLEPVSTEIRPLVSPEALAAKAIPLSAPMLDFGIAEVVDDK